MMSIVGPNGRITITKEIRDRLGVRPGWIAFQRLVGDHIEGYFLPPENRKSLKGSLAKYVKTQVAAGEEWSEVKERAWAGGKKKDGYKRHMA